MATNYTQPGDAIDVVAGGAITSGSVQEVGTLVGVALDAAASGETYALGLSGVYTINKDTALAITQGDRVFWDDGNSWVDKTATAQNCVGVAVTTQASADTTVQVLLRPNTPAGT